MSEENSTDIDQLVSEGEDADMVTISRADLRASQVGGKKIEEAEAAAQAAAAEADQLRVQLTLQSLGVDLESPQGQALSKLDPDQISNLAEAGALSGKVEEGSQTPDPAANQNQQQYTQAELDAMNRGDRAASGAATGDGVGNVDAAAEMERVHDTMRQRGANKFDAIAAGFSEVAKAVWSGDAPEYALPSSPLGEGASMADIERMGRVDKAPQFRDQDGRIEYSFRD